MKWLSKKKNQWISILCMIAMVFAGFRSTPVSAAEIKLNATEKILYLNADNITKTKSQFQLELTGYETRGATDWSFRWQSTNKKVITVNQKGLVKARGIGEAQVIVTITNETSKEIVNQLACTFVVKQNAKSITITGLPEKKAMGIRTPFTFQASILIFG